MNRIGSSLLKTTRSTSGTRRRSLHLQIGTSLKEKRVFTRDQVREFAEISHDMNPIHCDVSFANKMNFADCVVHGSLLNGYVAGLVGSRCPGAVLFKQQLQFHKPLLANQCVEASLVVNSIKRSFVFCTIKCEVLHENGNNEVVMSGTAVIKQ